MWRAFFMGVGIFACIFGAECMVSDRFVLGGEVKAPPAQAIFAAATAKKREWVPPEWAPWTFLSVGTVSILYSLTLPKMSGGGGGPPPGP